MTLEHPISNNNRPHRSLPGVIYDLDGTLVDSALDFAAMRAEMQLPAGVAILEAMESMAAKDLARCEAILHRHESDGARRATLLPGAMELLTHGARRGWRQAVLTRNSGYLAARVLARLSLAELVDPVIAREHGPAKPDPWAVHHICDLWGLTPAGVVVIGDYHFDIEAGRRAGARTVLVGPLAMIDAENEAESGILAEGEFRCPDLRLPSLANFSKLIDWIEGIDLGAGESSC